MRRSDAWAARTVAGARSRSAEHPTPSTAGSWPAVLDAGPQRIPVRTRIGGALEGCPASGCCTSADIDVDPTAWRQSGGRARSPGVHEVLRPRAGSRHRASTASRFRHRPGRSSSWPPHCRPAREPSGRCDNVWARNLTSHRLLDAMLDDWADRGRAGTVAMRDILERRPAGYVPPASNLESRFAHLADAPLHRTVPAADQPRRRGSGSAGSTSCTQRCPLVVEVLSQEYHAALFAQAADDRRFALLDRGRATRSSRSGTTSSGAMPGPGHAPGSRSAERQAPRWPTSRLTAQHTRFLRADISERQRSARENRTGGWRYHRWRWPSPLPPSRSGCRPTPPGCSPASCSSGRSSSGGSHGGDFRIPPDNIQPASVDLRLGAGRLPHALQLPAGLRAGRAQAEAVRDRRARPARRRRGARDQPARTSSPSSRRCALPPEVRGRANPKSSTGRLDVFTRVITDRSFRFDEIAAGYHGRLWLEVVPLSFTVRVRERLALNQLRLAIGDASLDDADLRATHEETPLLYRDGGPVPADELATANGLFLGLDLRGGVGRHVGWCARHYAPLVDLHEVGRYEPDQLLGAGHRRGRRPHRPQPGALLPAAVRRAGRGAAAPRGRDDRVRPDQRRAAHPLRRLLRSRASATTRPGSSPAPAPRSRCGPTTCRSSSATASRCASSPSSGSSRRRPSSTAQASARTTRARPRPWASTSAAERLLPSDPAEPGTFARCRRSAPPTGCS